MLGIEPWAKVDSYCCSSCQATDLGLTQVVSHVVECATEQDDAASGSVLIEVQAWQGVHRLFLVAEKRASLEQVARVILAEWFDPEFLATSVFWSLRSPAAFSCPVPFDHAKSVAILPDAICSLNSLSSNHRRRWPPDDARAMRAQLVGSFCGVDDTVLSFQCNNTQCLVKLSNLRRRRCRNLLTDDALSIVCRNNPPLIRCAAHPCHNAADVVFSDPPSRSLKSSTGSSFLPIQNFPASQFVCEADAPVTSFSCRISNSPNLRF
ncbi:MAG: hypothetical protein Q8P67_29075 [archaeon]|nr:hypothetical protein [archaeon]